MKTSPSVNTHLNKINKKIVVPRHRRDRNGSARQMGMKAEQAFWCCCQEQGYKWENASKAQNCTEHIDCFITKDGKTLSVDVKSAKKSKNVKSTGKVIVCHFGYWYMKKW